MLWSYRFVQRGTIKARKIRLCKGFWPYRSDQLWGDLALLALCRCMPLGGGNCSRSVTVKHPLGWPVPVLPMQSACQSLLSHATRRQGWCSSPCLRFIRWRSTKVRSRRRFSPWVRLLRAGARSAGRLLGKGWAKKNGTCQRCRSYLRQLICAALQRHTGCSPTGMPGSSARHRPVPA